MRWLFATLPTASCFYITEAERAERFDLDGDAVERPFDCNDQDPTLGAFVTRYQDLDQDGFGDPAGAVAACGEEPGTVDNDLDCDDTNRLTNPDAPERCDTEDNNCNAQIDEGQSEIEWYRDGDGDGYGDESDTVEFCGRPEGYSAEGRDCNDEDDAVNPDATEVCGGEDEDCDGLFDQDDPDLEPNVWFADLDLDGFGTPGNPVTQCEAPPGHVDNDLDCDDGDDAIKPGATERCTVGADLPADEDCDGVIDDDAVDRLQFYADADADGFGDAGVPVDACPPPGPGLSTNPSDCNDTRDDVYPGAPECSDGVDNDCNPATPGGPC